MVRDADDLLAICQTKREAEAALEALAAILTELGLELKEAKTRIVHLREGGEGVDFLGFHHRCVRGPRRATAPRVPRSLALTTGDRSMPATGVREITDRDGCCSQSRMIVQDLNGFLRGWAGYFRYGNSARHFNMISITRPTGSRCSWPSATNAQRYGWRVVTYHPGPLRTDQPQRNRRRAAPNRAWRQEIAECRR